jgi:hypothetical protein
MSLMLSVECHYAECRYAECRGASTRSTDYELSVPPDRYIYEQTAYKLQIFIQCDHLFHPYSE